MKPLLELEKLSIRIGDKTLVHEISFSLFPGKCLAIVGESGSGKTLSCLTLLQLNPTSFEYPTGEILMEGQWNPASSQIRTWRGKRIGMIFQEPMSALNPTMRVGDQITDALQLHLSMDKAAARRRVIELFEEVQIPSPATSIDKYPHEMSGGQRQRVMIAMAISCEPEILLADEPTTALDVSVQQAVLNLLRDIQLKRQMAMVFVSHDLAVVQSVADEIIVMQKGKVIEQGIAKQIIENPKEAYTQGLLNCRPHGRSPLYYLPTLQEPNPSIPRPQTKIGDSLIQVKSLTKKYDQFTAVSEVDFEIFQGETLGLIGESGCGKSTLSRMLMGLIPITSGEVGWKGDSWFSDRVGIKKKDRKRVQMVFQDPFSSLNPKITIGEQIMEPMRIHGIGKNSEDRWSKAVQWMEKVGMPEPEQSLYKYPHAFSGGQRQRIVIARALAAEPECIICDESVAALDVSVQAQVLNLLNQLKAELGLTFLFISHDLHVVRYMCDRVMIMQQGKIVEMGATEVVFQHPQHPYSQTLLSK